MTYTEIDQFLEETQMEVDLVLEKIIHVEMDQNVNLEYILKDLSLIYKTIQIVRSNLLKK